MAKKLTKIQKSEQDRKDAAEARAWLGEARQTIVGVLGKVGPVVSNPVAMYLIGNVVVHHLDEKHTGWLDEKSASDFKGGLMTIATTWAAAQGVGAVV